MNLVLIAAILILALNIVLGYKEGLVKAAYSLVSWILIMVLTTCLTPLATDWVMNNTSVPTRIESYVYEQIKKGVEEKQKEVQEQLGTQVENQLEFQGGEGLEALEQYGIQLPDAILNKLEEVQEEWSIEEPLESITDSAVSPAFRTLAATITAIIVKGVVSVVILILAIIIVFVIGAVLDIVSKLPVINTANKTLGVAVGALKGILVIWLLLAILSFFSVTEVGRTLIAWIYENPVLIWIYENNPLLNLLFLFI